MEFELDTPEERLAQRVISRRGLVPRIDVEVLARSLAHVEVKKFPFGIDIDGLCLDLKRPGRKPRIWLNAQSGYHRQRFTLAHEIGHIVIPWHTGSIVDELDAADPGERGEYRIMEAQANRFAAELLMPKAWATDICRRAEHMAVAMRTIASVADVSNPAAALRASQAGAPGYLVAAVAAGIVTWSSRTIGTRGRPPKVGASLDDVDMPAFHKPEVVGSGTTLYYWWQAREGVSPTGRPEEPWREILDRILLDLTPENRHKARQSINAIIGYAMGRLSPGSPVEAIYQQILEALQNRSDRDNNIVTLLRHPDINQYILARAYERAEA